MHAPSLQTRPLQPPTARPIDRIADGMDLDGRPPRVVIDTPVVLSALMFGGEAATRLRRAWRAGFCRPMLCRSTLLDLTQALAEPRLGLPADEQRRLLAEYLPHALKVRVAGAALPGRARPASLPFVQLAMAGRAHLMVSADAALLGHAGGLPFPVLALDPFLDLLRGSAITPQPLRPAAPARAAPSA